MSADAGKMGPQPMRAGQVLDAVFLLYRRNFWLFVLVVAVVQVPYQVLAAILTSRVAAGGGLLHRTGPGNGLQLVSYDHSAVVAGGLYALLLLVFVLAAVPIEAAAFTSAVADRYQARPTSLGGAYRAGLGRWLPLLGVGVIVVALVLAVAVVLGIVSVLLAVLLHPLGVLLAGLIWLAALVLGVFAYTRLVIALPVVVLEPIGPWLALERAWRLTVGSFWRLFGVLLLLLILVAVAALVIGLAFAALAAAAGGHLAGGVVSVVGEVVSSSLLSPVISVGIVLLYFDLLARHASSTALPAGDQPALQF